MFDTQHWRQRAIDRSETRMRQIYAGNCGSNADRQTGDRYRVGLQTLGRSARDGSSISVGRKRQDVGHTLFIDQRLRFSPQDQTRALKRCD